MTDSLQPFFGSRLGLQTKSCFLDDDDGFKCKTYGLSFKSQQELQEHDRAYGLHILLSRVLDLLSDSSRVPEPLMLAEDM